MKELIRNKMNESDLGNVVWGNFFHAQQMTVEKNMVSAIICPGKGYNPWTIKAAKASEAK